MSVSVFVSASVPLPPSLLPLLLVIKIPAMAPVILEQNYQVTFCRVLQPHTPDMTCWLVTQLLYTYYLAIQLLSWYTVIILLYSYYLGIQLFSWYAVIILLYSYYLGIQLSSGYKLIAYSYYQITIHLLSCHIVIFLVYSYFLGIQILSCYTYTYIILFFDTQLSYWYRVIILIYR